jgi:hypothetical protein
MYCLNYQDRRVSPASNKKCGNAVWSGRRLPAFRRNIMHQSWRPKSELSKQAVCSSLPPTNFHQPIWCHIPEDNLFNLCRIFTNKHVSTAIMEETFSTRSVPSYISQVSSCSQRTAGVQSLWAVAARAGRWGRGHFGNPQERKRLPLEAATKQRQWRRDSTLVCVCNIEL